VNVATENPTAETLSAQAPTPTVVIQPGRGLWDLGLAALWEYRELLYFLVWRDVKIRYKQTALGVAWAVLQPVLMMAIFTVVFSRLARVPSEGLPYPLFAFVGLLPWTCFAEALSRGSVSVASEAQLIRKIYFPRLLIPLAGVVAPLVDFGIAFILLLGMMIWYGVVPTVSLLALPGFLLFAVATSLAVSLWLSALNAKYRDVKHTIPFLVQIWLFASPVAYPVSMVPEAWRTLYSLNPMAGVIEGFRWALLGKQSPDFALMAVSAGVVAILLLGGLVYFRHMERSFADVI
jgi:lipopolysaccharide transport system permease protein